MVTRPVGKKQKIFISFKPPLTASTSVNRQKCVRRVALSPGFLRGIPICPHVVEDASRPFSLHLGKALFIKQETLAGQGPRSYSLL